MKILFDIRKGTGGRTYSYSLNCQSFEMICGKKIVNPIRTITGVPVGIINNILKEFEKTGELTGKNLTNLDYYLCRKGTSVIKMNEETEL